MLQTSDTQARCDGAVLKWGFFADKGNTDAYTVDQVQASLKGISGSVSDYRNKASITIKQVT